MKDLYKESSRINNRYKLMLKVLKNIKLTTIELNYRVISFSY